MENKGHIFVGTEITAAKVVHHVGQEVDQRLLRDGLRLIHLTLMFTGTTKTRARHHTELTWAHTKGRTNALDDEFVIIRLVPFVNGRHGLGVEALWQNLDTVALGVGAHQFVVEHTLKLGQLAYIHLIAVGDHESHWQGAGGVFAQQPSLTVEIPSCGRHNFLNA